MEAWELIFSRTSNNYNIAGTQNNTDVHDHTRSGPKHSPTSAHTIFAITFYLYIIFEDCDNYDTVHTTWTTDDRNPRRSMFLISKSPCFTLLYLILSVQLSWVVLRETPIMAWWWRSVGECRAGGGGGSSKIPSLFTSSTIRNATYQTF